jgi:hypothetical protein
LRLKARGAANVAPLYKRVTARPWCLSRDPERHSGPHARLRASAGAFSLHPNRDRPFGARNTTFCFRSPLAPNRRNSLADFVGYAQLIARIS